MTDLVLFLKMNLSKWVILMSLGTITWTGTKSFKPATTTTMESSTFKSSFPLASIVRPSKMITNLKQLSGFWILMETVLFRLMILKIYFIHMEETKWIISSGTLFFKRQTLTKMVWYLLKSSRKQWRRCLKNPLTKKPAIDEKAKSFSFTWLTILI